MFVVSDILPSSVSRIPSFCRSVVFPNIVVEVVPLSVVLVNDVDEVVLANVRSSSVFPLQPVRKTAASTTTAARRIISFFNSLHSLNNQGS